MTDYTPIINAILAVLGAVVTAFVIPWIKANTTQKQRENVLGIVRVVVNAAEQLYKGSGRGDEKKEYVKKTLADMGIRLEDLEIDTMIENFVLGLKQGKEEIRHLKWVTDFGYIANF